MPARSKKPQLLTRDVAPDPLLTVPQVCAELSISRSTFYHWRQTGKGPKCLPLPNGALRVRRSALDTFLTELEAAA